MSCISKSTVITAGIVCVIGLMALEVVLPSCSTVGQILAYKLGTVLSGLVL